MFTQRNTENERGALMIEAIALLGLMTMMSPMVVRQTAERTSEMEEVAVAGQMKELKDAVNNYIASDYSSILQRAKASNLRNGSGQITINDIRPFISSSLLETVNGNIGFRGNKLVDGYNLGYRYECVEHLSGGHSVACNGDACSAADCSKMRITGIVLSNGEAIDDRRASRIASMIGADGGYVRSEKLLTSLGQEDNESEKNKILGSQGIWESATSDFGLGNASGGQIAATTTFSAGTSSDFLYRRPMPGLPDANSMFTDLDMGGANPNCSGPDGGCNKINNAGGLEVVNGRIVIRSANNNLPANQEGNAGDVISLDRENVVMNVSQNINLAASNVLISAGGDPGYPGDYTNIRMDRLGMDVRAQQSINLNVNNSTSVNLSEHDIVLNAGGGGSDVAKITVSNATGLGEIAMQADAYTKMSMYDSDIDMQADYSRLHLGYDYINMNTDDISLNASNYLNMKADEIKAKADYSIHMSVRDYTYLSMTDEAARLKGDLRASVSTDTAGLSMSSDDVDFANLYAGDGDVSLNLDGYSSNMSGLVNGTGTNKSTFALTPTQYNLNVGGNAAGFRLYGSSYANGYSYSYANLNTVSGISLSALGNKSNQETYGKAWVNVDQGAVYLHSDNTHSYWNNQYLDNGEAWLNVRGAMINLNTRASSGMTSNLSFRPDQIIYQMNSMHNSSDTDRTSGQMSIGYSGFKITNANLYGFDTGKTTNDRYQTWHRATLNIRDEDTGYAVVVTTTNQRGEHNSSLGRGWIGVDVNSSSKPAGVTDAQWRNMPKLASYQVHYGNCDTSRGNTTESCLPGYQLDLPFISVMNDIALTSRGGARLSEAMPNYILKGIYLLSNSYTHGKWPCNAKDLDGNIISKCRYVLPRYSNEQLAMSGNYQFQCPSGAGANHPMQGYCSETPLENDSHGNANGYVTFDFPTEKYSESCSFTGGTCWAHPFLGIVPAPGRAITPASGTAFDGAGNMYAYDEGPCPGGYRAVMTVTPTIFELGKVSRIVPFNETGQIALPNAGYQNFTNSSMRDDAKVLQMGTKLGIITKDICSAGSDNDCTAENSRLYGWAIAMGTVTQEAPGASGYIWNVGGIPQNSWQATVHTYCYFNPDRFILPNMYLNTADDTYYLDTMSSGWSYQITK